MPLPSPGEDALLTMVQVDPPSAVLSLILIPGPLIKRNGRKFSKLVYHHHLCTVHLRVLKQP